MRHKKGDVCDTTGRIFWAYGKNFKGGEYWVSPDQYAVLDEKRKARLTPEVRAKRQQQQKVRRSTAEHKVKAAAYTRQYRQNPAVRQREKDRLAAIPKVEKLLKMGHVHPETGMVFWAYGRGCRNGEDWLTPEVFKQRRDRTYVLRKTRFSCPEKRAEHNRKQRERYLRDEALRVKRNEAHLAYMLKWVARPGNKERLVAARKVWTKKYFESRPLMKMARSVRTRIGNSIKANGYRKNNVAAKFLGCDWPTFAAHIEAQFKGGMTWDNYGEWEVDHIFPVSRAVSEEHLLGILHYTNTRPLWRNENRMKKDKVPPEAPAHLVAMAQLPS